MIGGELPSPRWVTAPGTPWRAVPASPEPRVLVHQARFHVGDALWLTPLLRALRGFFPGAETTVVGPVAARRVLAGNPHVAEVVVYPEDGGHRERRRVLAALSGRSFDAALFAFARRPESVWLARAAAEQEVPCRVNLEYFDPEHDPARIAPWATHEGWWAWSSLASPEMLLHALDPFFERGARPAADRTVELHLSAEARRRGRHALARRGLEGEPFVVLAPGGLSSERWPTASFAELAARLVSDLGVRVLIEGAPWEEELLAEVGGSAARRLAEARHRIHVAADPLDVFAAVLGRARLLVANDSAPIHLAEAVGTPSVYFAQRKKLVHSRPAGEARALLDPLGDAVARIPVEQAAAAVKEMLRSQSRRRAHLIF